MKRRYQRRVRVREIKECPKVQTCRNCSIVSWKQENFQLSQQARDYTVLSVFDFCIHLLFLRRMVNVTTLSAYFGFSSVYQGFWVYETPMIAQ